MNKVTLNVKRLGIYTEYEGWTQVSITKSLENLSGTFSISLTQLFDSNNSTRSVIKEGDEVIILIDGIEIINGFVDTSDISYNTSTHLITVSGRDKTCDLIDSSLYGNLNINAPYTIENLFKKILTSLNLQNSISVTNTVTGLTAYEDNFEADRGKKIWPVLDKYLQKKSVFASVSGNGDIIIFRGSFGTTGRELVHFINDNKFNNILSGKKISDLSQRFNEISVLSQSSSETSVGNYSNQGGESFKATDGTIRNSRKLEILAKTNLSSQECKDLADFNVNVRQARGTKYIYTVQGFHQQGDSGELWSPNYLVHVTDELLNIFETFLIKSVTFSQDSDNGSITTLELTDKNAYSLRAPVALGNDTDLIGF